MVVGGRGYGGPGRRHQGPGECGRVCGRSYYSNNDKYGHPEAKWIRGPGGKQIEIHPSYDFPGHIWNNIPRGDQEKRREARQKYKSNKRVTSAVSLLINNSNLDTKSVVSVVTEATRNKAVSQATMDNNVDNRNTDANNEEKRTTMMAGRREKTNLQTRNRGVVVLTAKRAIGASRAKGISLELDAGTAVNNEADSNAEICCLGSNFIALAYANKMADVYLYDSTYEPIVNTTFVIGATTYTDGNT